MRVLMITQRVDPNDAALGFVVRWIEAIAAKVNHLNIICLDQPTRKVLEALPRNVKVSSMGKERGVGRLLMLLNFWRNVWRSSRGVSAIFSHMVPRYAVLAAPIAKIRRTKHILWYTHRQITGELRLALRLVDVVLTAAPESFPIEAAKVHSLGHGIDADFFTPDANVPKDEPPLIVQVARLMPIKHQSTLIKAVAALKNEGLSFKVGLIGGVPEGESDAYARGLRQLALDSGVHEQIIYTGTQTQAAVRRWYQRAAVAVNLSPTGLFDKAALEPMFCGVPTVVSSAAFDGLVADQAPRIAGPDDADGLAMSLRALLSLEAARRAEIGQVLRARVIRQHSLDQLAEKLVSHFGKQQF